MFYKELYLLQYITLLSHPSDYDDILYDQVYNISFHQKLESNQYNACLAITGAILGPSKEEFCQERGLESFQLRCWHRKLGMFYKTCESKSPQYLFKLIPEKTSSYVTKNADNTPFLIRSKTFMRIFSFRRPPVSETT